MTEGRGRVRVPPTTGLPPSAITVALPARTSTRARRNETTASGSYPALRTRVRTRVTPFRSGRAPGWWRHDLPRGVFPATRAGDAGAPGTRRWALASGRTTEGAAP